MPFLLSTSDCYAQHKNNWGSIHFLQNFSEQSRLFWCYPISTNIPTWFSRYAYILKLPTYKYFSLKWNWYFLILLVLITYPLTSMKPKLGVFMFFRNLETLESIIIQHSSLLSQIFKAYLSIWTAISLSS